MVQPSILNLDSESSYDPAKYTYSGTRTHLVQFIGPPIWILNPASILDLGS
jgi:hypothetical protein